MIQNKITLNLDDEDVWPLFCAAFRYALGRRTYMPSLIAEIILANKEQLTKYQRQQIVREISEFEEMFGNLGDECDSVTWHRFADELMRGD